MSRSYSSGRTGWQSSHYFALSNEGENQFSGKLKKDLCLVLCPRFRMLRAYLETINYTTINLQIRKQSCQEDITFAHIDGVRGKWKQWLPPRIPDFSSNALNPSVTLNSSRNMRLQWHNSRKIWTTRIRVDLSAPRGSQRKQRSNRFERLDGWQQVL